MKSFFLLFALIFAFAATAFSQPLKPKDESRLNEKRQELAKIKIESSVESLSERSKAEAKANILGVPVRAELDDNTVIELEKFDGVFPLYKTTTNAIAAQTTAADLCWPGGMSGFGLTGYGVILGEWDAGAVYPEHQEFTGGRLIQRDNPSSVHYHATHVAGTMIAAGVDPQAKGMCYEGSLWAYDWNNTLSEQAAAALEGLRVSNHSWGYITGWRYNYRGDGRYAWFGDANVSDEYDHSFGFYNSNAQEWDDLAYNAPYYLIVNSAGNDRNDGPGSAVEHWYINPATGQWELTNTFRYKDGGTDGYDCISHFSLGKNLLTVAAVYGIEGGYDGPSSVRMSSFSSWGPADDGRIKPDVCGDGVSVYSTMPYGVNSYSRMSGTSMAGPNVCGSSGLLLQMEDMLYEGDPFLSSTLKGLILHTADEAGPDDGPDYMFGWGLMNTYKAAQLMQTNTIYSGGFNIQEFALEDQEELEFDVYSYGTDALKITICWTDLPGTPVAKSLNPRDIMLVNDLDLRIFAADGTEYFPWALDPENPSAAAQQRDNIVDNVEQVYIAAPEEGVYTVKVNHKGVLATGVQNFSIIITGAGQLVTPQIAYPENCGYNIPVSPRIMWEEVEFADIYRVQIARDEDFEDVEIEYESSTPYIEPDLNLSQGYFLRARAENDAEDGPWSETVYFKTTGGGDLSANLEDKTTCYGEPVELGAITETPNGCVISSVVEGGSGDYMYSWSPRRGLANYYTANPTVLRPTRSTIYTLVVTDRETRRRTYARMRLTVLPAPSASLPRYIYASRGEEIELGSRLSVRYGQSPYSYYWEDMRGWESILENPAIIADDSKRYYLTVTGADGCESSRSSVYVRVLSRKDADFAHLENIDSNISAYPNPVSTILNIETNFEKQTNLSIWLYNALGETIYSGSQTTYGFGKLALDLEAIPTGLYVLKVKAGEQITTRKIIKE